MGHSIVHMVLIAHDLARAIGGILREVRAHLDQYRFTNIVMLKYRGGIFMAKCVMVSVGFY